MENMIVLSLNIQGLLNSFKEMKYVINKQKVNICLLNETHLTLDIENNELKMSGYNIIRCDSDSRYTGGVVAYIENNIKFNVVKTYGTEFFWIITFQMSIGHGNITIAAVYISPSENKMSVMNYVSGNLARRSWPVFDEYLWHNVLKD